MKVSTILFDLGGVLLTNGMDSSQRRVLVERFALDGEEHENRHRAHADALDDGEISLDDYLEEVVFYRPRSFSKGEFIRAVEELSVPYPEMVAFAKSFVGQYRLGTLNNESRELHEYRVRTYGLREIFSVFFCSGYLGCSKPGKEIYEKTLGMLSADPREVLFIDDRIANIETAKGLGFHAVHHVEVGETVQMVNALLGLPESRPGRR